jgi:hypothetical protein
MAALRRQVRNPDGGVQIVVLAHPGCAGVTVLDESTVDRSGFRDRRWRQVEFGGCENRALLTAAITVAKVNDTTVLLDKAISEVCVGPTVFGMQNAASLLIFKTKLDFKVAEKNPDRLRVVVADIRVDMDMPQRPVGTTMCGTRDKLTKLPGKVRSRQMAGGDEPHPLAAVERKKMPSKSGAAPPRVSPDSMTCRSSF